MNSPAKTLNDIEARELIKKLPPPQTKLSKRVDRESVINAINNAVQMLIDDDLDRNARAWNVAVQLRTEGMRRLANRINKLVREL